MVSAVVFCSLLPWAKWWCWGCGRRQEYLEKISSLVYNCFPRPRMYPEAYSSNCIVQIALHCSFFFKKSTDVLVHRRKTRTLMEPSAGHGWTVSLTVGSGFSLCLSDRLIVSDLEPLFLVVPHLKPQARYSRVWFIYFVSHSSECSLPAKLHVCLTAPRPPLLPEPSVSGTGLRCKRMYGIGDKKQGINV